MSFNDPLAVILTRAGIVDDVLEIESADRLAEALGLDPVTADEFVRTLASNAEWDGESSPDGEFEFRIGRWRLDLTTESLRAGVMAAVLGAVFTATGTQPVGLALLAAIVPSLMDVEDVTLSDGDQRLLIDVRRIPQVTDALVRAEDLYDQLPDHVRDVLNRYDFADFLERLREADAAVGDSEHRLIRVRREGEAVPLIRWR